MNRSALGPLFWKELRQIGRSRRAILSSTLLPILILVVIPLGQLSSIHAAGSAPLRTGPPGSFLPPGIDSNDPVQLFTRVLFPLFVTISSILVPSVAATATIVTERERRSLELLMALPVRVWDVLAAKVLALLVMASLVLVPLFVLDAAVLLAMRVVTPLYVAMLALVLLSAMACSIGIALLLALLARDFRTANNLNGAMVGPLILASMAILFFVPGDTRLLVLAGALLLVATAAFVAAVRWLTFERYLA